MASARSGAELLDALHAALSRYVVLPSEQAAHAATLWIAATHAQPAWEHAPRLAAISAVKRSGKSRLMDVAAETCHNPIITFNATIAAIVRSIDSDDPPTLLVDEADALFGSRKAAEQNEDLRGLLNSGHQRNRPLLRWDMTSRSLDELPTFAMAMLASIGDLPATIMDRAVVARMRRRAPGEKIEPWRSRRDAPPLNELRGQLHKMGPCASSAATGRDPGHAAGGSRRSSRSPTWPVMPGRSALASLPRSAWVMCRPT